MKLKINLIVFFYPSSAKKFYILSDAVENRSVENRRFFKDFDESFSKTLIRSILDIHQPSLGMILRLKILIQAFLPKL